MILRNRTADTLEQYGKWFLILPPLVLVLMPALLITLLLGPERVADFYSELLQRDKIFNFLMPAVLIAPFVWGAIHFSIRSQLEINDLGIRFTSGAPEWLGQHTDWQVLWKDIESVKLETPPLSHPLTAVIHIRAVGRARQLRPWQWVIHGSAKHGLTTLLLGRRKQHFQQLLAATPLVTELQSRELLPKNEDDTGTPNDLRIAGTPSKLIALIFVFAVIYFIGDSYFGLKEYYAGTPPWQWHFAIALIATVLAWLALNQSKDGAAQVLLAAILFGGGMALAAYPGLLRLNAWMDTNGLAGHEYTLGEGDTWRTAAAAPDLVFDIDSRYWKQFEPGDVKTFEIRHGGLGFYQVNMAPVYQDQKAFYAAEQ